jgi:hypothetical protein
MANILNINIDQLPANSTINVEVKNENYVQHWFNEGGRIIVNNSAFGCGYNVLCFLRIINRFQCTALITNLVNNNNNNYVGLPMIDMYQYINHNNLLTHRFYLRFGNGNENRRYIITRFLQVLATITRGGPRPNQERYVYIIIKLSIDSNTGLGHSIVFCTDIINNIDIVFDPQKTGRPMNNNPNQFYSGLNTIDEFIDYIANHNIYQGVTVMGSINQQNAGNPKTPKSLSKTSKSKSKSKTRSKSKSRTRSKSITGDKTATYLVNNKYTEQQIMNSVLSCIMEKDVDQKGYFKLNKNDSKKLEIAMNSSEGYGTYFKKGATYKEVFGNFGSEPNIPRTIFQA